MQTQEIGISADERLAAQERTSPFTERNTKFLSLHRCGAEERREGDGMNHAQTVPKPMDRAVFDSIGLYLTIYIKVLNVLARVL